MSDLIEKLSDLRSQYNCFDENEYETYHTLSEAIKVLSEQPEACEDAVSRKSIRDKISEKDNWEKYDRYNLGLHDAMRIVRDEPSVTPKLAPCEDTVSRKTAVDALDEAKMIMMSVIDSLPENVKNEEAKIRIETISATVDSVKQILEKLPSVTPKRKTGKWIYNNFTQLFHCSECNFELYCRENFCPDCGADMNSLLDPYKPKEKNNACD